jgi:hypothetical protein
MKKTLTKNLLAVALISLAFSTTATASFAAIKNGDACSPAGATFKQGATTFTCTQSGKKAAWKAAAPAVKKTSSSALTSKSFRLDSSKFSSDYGVASATARITNIAKSSKSAIFTITIFESDGKSVATTLTGSAMGISPGSTTTVQFVGMGDLPKGAFTYGFQVDMEY